jgi:hypothetical protein
MPLFFPKSNIQGIPTPEMFLRIIALSMAPSNQIVVDQVIGNDGNNGTPIAPFKTIGAAMAQIIANADYSASKPYVVTVHPGVYVENVQLLPFVWIIGDANVWAALADAPAATSVAPVTISGTVSVNSLWSVAGARGGLINIAVNNDTDLSWPVYINTAVVDLIGCSLVQVNSIFSNANNGGLNLVGGTLSGLGTVNGFNYVTGAVIDGSWNVAGNQVNVVSGLVSPSGATVNVGANDGSTVSFDFSNCSLDSVTVNGSTSSAKFDAVSFPNTLTLSNGGTASLKTLAPALGYTPSAPSKWAGTPPATAQDALDRLAAVAITPP